MEAYVWWAMAALYLFGLWAVLEYVGKFVRTYRKHKRQLGSASTKSSGARGRIVLMPQPRATAPTYRR